MCDFLVVRSEWPAVVTSLLTGVVAAAVIAAVVVGIVALMDIDDDISLKGSDDESASVALSVIDDDNDDDDDDDDDLSVVVSTGCCVCPVSCWSEQTVAGAAYLVLSTCPQLSLKWKKWEMSRFPCWNKIVENIIKATDIVASQALLNPIQFFYDVFVSMGCVHVQASIVT